MQADTRTTDHTTARAWATLVRTPALSSAALRRALQQTGGAAGLMRRPAAALCAMGLGEPAAQFIAQPPQEEIERDLQWLASSGATLLPFCDPHYPLQLAALSDAPIALYVLGDPAHLRAAQIAIVGSRTPTAAGRKIAAQIATQLANANLTITSGLARGIDTAAHEAALAAHAPTIAVCGTGLDQCYPAENQPLFERIVGAGALVSEFPPRTPARPHHFPRRNRIISGLARGVVVVEAAAGSGSLITARRALDQGRELFVVPGSPLNPLAAGCLELIREGACVVRSAADILDEISIPIEGNDQANQRLESSIGRSRKNRLLDKPLEMLLDALGFEPASIDDLVDRTGLAPGSIAAMMLILELEGRVETRPGALYNRVAQ